MEFESTPPKAPDAVSEVDLKTALSAIQLDVTVAETAITAALKRVIAKALYGYAKLRRFKDLEHVSAVNNGMWVQRCSIGFSEQYLKDKSDWIEYDLEKWIKDLSVVLSEMAGRSGLVPVIIDGLKVRLQKVSPVAYSLTLALSYTFEGENGK